jgi:hypothetical protein
MFDCRYAAPMASRVTSDDDTTRQVFSRAHHRTTKHGELVVVIPTRCPTGLHVLANGCRIHETAEMLYISCHACLKSNPASSGWSFTTGGRTATSAEFDDGPYADLIER